MRILHLDSGREMRGGQWQALRLHRGLIAAGHHSLLLARDASPLLSLANQWGLPCEALSPLRLALQTRSFDLLHVHDARSHTLAALFSRVPFVVSRRVAFPVRQSMLSQWKYRKPALFLAVSEYVARQLRDAGVSNKRIAVVYDGIPVPPQPSAGHAHLAPYTEDPAKGMALAKQAAKLAGVTLELTKDLEGDLPRAKVLLYLTRSEGLGSGILLAMAHGVIVIASNKGGIPELIQNEVNGILVPNQAEAVAQALARVSANPDRQFGTAARQTVLQRFTEEHMVQSTLAAYTTVIHA